MTYLQTAEELRRAGYVPQTYKQARLLLELPVQKGTRIQCYAAKC